MEYKIGEIADIKSGKRLPKGKEFCDKITEHRYIRARDIKNRKILDENIVYIDEETHSKIKKYIIEFGDIAITIVGENIGDIGYCGKALDKSNLTENAVRLTNFKTDIVNSIYLSYYLNQKFMKEYMRLIGSGAAQGKLGIYKIQKIKVNLPDVETQNKIVELLLKYDELIEKNDECQKNLQCIIEELYSEWFVRFRFPGYEKYKFLYSKPRGWICGNTEHNQIPENWHYGQLNEIGQFVRGKNITSEQMIYGEIPVISAGIQPAGYHNKSNVNGNSLTMSASGANAGYLQYNLEDVWAADCSYYQNNENIWFVYCSLNFIESAIKNLQVGAAQPHVYPKNINKLNIIIPEEKYIKLFQKTVNPMFEEIKILKQKNKNLIKQRNLLLPRLMSGKLEIK